MHHENLMPLESVIFQEIMKSIFQLSRVSYRSALFDVSLGNTKQEIQIVHYLCAFPHICVSSFRAVKIEMLLFSSPW